MKVVPPEAPSALPPGGAASGPAEPAPRRLLDMSMHAVPVARSVVERVP
jgi:hypothetical protein